MVEGAAMIFNAEGWQSGLTRRTRNAVGEKSPHRFESCTLRDEYHCGHDLKSAPEAEQMRCARKGTVGSNPTLSALDHMFFMRHSRKSAADSGIGSEEGMKNAFSFPTSEPIPADFHPPILYPPR